MRLRRVESRPPQAYRALVTGADDAGPIEFALAMASAWSDRPILVVNATGKDLGAFGSRFDLIEVVDDAGRPSRSLTEVIGVLESGEVAAVVGAVVLLDANRLYRAVRCAARDAKSIESLSAGQWDSANEALGLLGETLTRLGLPSVFYAPPTDVYGPDDHGEPTVVGTKPQAWKDLARTAHLSLTVTRSGPRLTAEVAGDDWGRIGKPGTRIEDASASEVGERVADLARAARPGEAATTILSESSAAELAARAERASARREQAAKVRTRLLNLAELRAQQGRWDEYTAEISSSVDVLDAQDLAEITKRSDQALARWGEYLGWMRAAQADIERCSYSLHEQRPKHVAGPAIGESPARDDMPVDDLLAMPPALAPLRLRDAAAEDLAAWIASLAQYAGVWSEAPFAVACASAGLAALGPEWHAYSTEALRGLALHCLSLAKIRHHYDPPRRPRAIEETPVAPVVEPPAEPRSEPTPATAEKPRAIRPVDPEPQTITLRLPTLREFDNLERAQASDWLNVLLRETGWRDRMDRFCDAAEIAPKRMARPDTWERAQRSLAYFFLIREAENRRQESAA